VKPQILDCTLRDGGYYNNWNFKETFVEKYLSVVSKIPISDVELGYINPHSTTYKGQYYHLNRITLEYCRERLREDQRIWVMFDYKFHDQVPYLEKKFSELGNLLWGIRFTVPYDYDEESLLQLVSCAKKYGRKISLNLMYAHKYLDDQDALQKLQALATEVDVISLVDSYGVLLPTQVSDLISLMNRKFEKNYIGYHGHNNQELASANALTALFSGASCIDCTFNGLGRGAGNVRTELFLSTLSGVEKFSQLFNTSNGWRNAVCEIEASIKELNLEMNHGPSAPYAVAAVSGIPQSSVMSLLALKRFSAAEVVQLVNSDASKLVTQNSQFRTHFVETNTDPINVFVSNSERYEFTEAIAKSIKEKFEIENIYFLDLNAFERFATEKIQKIFNCVLVSSETNLQRVNRDDQWSRKVSTPPHNSKNDMVESITPVVTLNSPLEVALIDSLKSNVNNIVFWGIDGERGAAVDETEQLLSNSLYSKFNFYSFTPTGYQIGGLDAFS